MTGNLGYDIIGVGYGNTSVSGGNVFCIFFCNSFGFQCVIDLICHFPAAESSVQKDGFYHFSFVYHGCFCGAGTYIYSYLVHFYLPPFSDQVKKSRGVIPCSYCCTYIITFR